MVLGCLPNKHEKLFGWFDVSMRKRLAFVVVWDNAGNDFSGSSCFLDR